MERLFRSLKTEWIPTIGYPSQMEAKRDISEYLMSYYNWQRPHQYNGGLPPAEPEKKLKLLSGITWPLQTGWARGGLAEMPVILTKS